MHARMQGVENSELGFVPARQTTLLHGGVRKGEGEGEKERATARARERERESGSESERGGK